MAREPMEAVCEAESDPRVGALVVAGGGHFCAGADRGVLGEAARDPLDDGAYRDIEALYRAFARSARSPCPRSPR